MRNDWVLITFLNRFLTEMEMINYFNLDLVILKYRDNLNKYMKFICDFINKLYLINQGSTDNYPWNGLDI